MHIAKEEEEVWMKHELTVAEEDAVERSEERAAEGVPLALPAPLALRLGAVQPLRLVQLLPLLADLHPPVLPLRRRRPRPHLHRLHPPCLRARDTEDGVSRATAGS